MRDALELRGVIKTFGRSVGLGGVDWVGGRGVIGVLGPNGAGKSTLLRVLGTVLRPDRGDVRLLGFDPARPQERLAIRRQLGYLPQQAHLYPGFTAFDLVDYVAVLKEFDDRQKRRDEVRRVLDAVGLNGDMHRRIRTLSGGTRRRVALGAALLGQPPLLVLDEPSAGLDPDQRQRLRQTLAQAGREGTVVFSTHLTEEVAGLCHWVVVLDRGRVCFDGTPRQLAATADGQVWVDDRTDPDAARSWTIGEGEVRNVGRPPPGAQLLEPTVDEGYHCVINSDDVAARR